MILGIFGAEEQEVAPIIARYNGVSVVRAGMTFVSGSINGLRVVTACGAIGKVAAAVCSQILISEFKVTQIINIGTAGSLSDTLQHFDLVLADDTVQYDVQVCSLGYAAGQVPGYADVFFKTDGSMRTLLRQAFERVKGSGRIASALYEGRIASGDTFVDSQVQAENIRSAFNALCVEMEGAAVAQVCAVNDVPAAVLRCISDTAGTTGSAQFDYMSFSKQAAAISAEVILSFIEHCA